MKNTIYLITLLSLVSCELIIDVDTPEFQPSIVMASVLNPEEEVISVTLASDKYVLDNFSNFEPITGALVELYENDILVGVLNELNDTLSLGEFQPGKYQIARQPQSGFVYRLEVAKEGFRTVIAEESLDMETPDFEVISARRRGNPFDTYNLDLILDIQINDAIGDNYYQIIGIGEYNFPVPDSEGQDSLVRVRENFYLDSENLAIEDHLRDDLLFDDKLFDGRSYSLQLEAFPFIPFQSEDFDPEFRIFIEVRQLSTSYFNYLNTSLLQDWVEGDPFAEPVQVFSNVENGRGFLGGYVSNVVELELEE